MTCREFIEFLMAYLSGELPGGQRAVFDEHLAVCPACVHYLDSYRRTVEVARVVCRCPEDEVSADVPEDLIRAILAARDAMA